MSPTSQPSFQPAAPTDKKTPLKDLRDIPAVFAYLSRIGAEVRSFRSAVVNEKVNGYNRDRAKIVFKEDGSIEAPDGFKPTDAEQVAIKVACANLAWPKQIPATRYRPRPKEVTEANKKDVFEFLDTEGQLLMLQVRKELESEKVYLPWTFWDDGEWRQMEPDGPLPLWGLDQLKDHGVVFLHEGAKAARAVREMVEAETPDMQDKLKSHPWSKALKHAAHLGWIGGAHAPHRTDWSALKKGGVYNVYIVTDNDDPGLAAFLPIVEHIRRAIDCPVIHVRFEERNRCGKLWPVGFDLADPFPARMFKEVNGVRRYVGPSFRSRSHPIIDFQAGKLSDLTSDLASQGESALITTDAEIFRRGDKLVRPIAETVPAAHGRETKIAVLKPVLPVVLRDILSRNVYWRRTIVKTTAKGTTTSRVFVNPPNETAETILGREGSWAFRQIVGIITTPTMRPDGSLLVEPGYDAATKLLLIDPLDIPVIPDSPSKSQAEEALAVLEGLLIDFPFTSDVSKAVALSALMTPVVRGAFDVVPMHVARAPVAGSGKSYLFDIVAAIATGSPMPVMTAGDDEGETEKRLAAALMAGMQLISIDNVNGDLKSDSLCTIITQSTVKLRILGKSEMVTFEGSNTSIFATGNNITICGDLGRRSLIMELEQNDERPELREFRINPLDEVLKDRGKYVAAVLTICRAYVAAGRPIKPPPIGSFGSWSDLVRSSLMWLGTADPCKSMEISREEDPELGELTAILTAWAEALGVGYPYRFTLKQVLDMANESEILPDGFGSKTTYKREALHNAINALKGSRSVVDLDAFSRWASRRKKRLVGNYRLVNKPESKGGSKWWIEHKDDITIDPAL